MHISMLFLLWAHQLLSRNEIMQPQQFSLEGVLDALPSGPVKRPWHGNKSFRPTRNSLFFFFELRSAKRFMSVFWPHKATDGRVSSGSRTFRRAALCSSHGNHHHKLVCSKGGRERPSRSWAFLFFSIYFFIVILPFFYWPWRLSWWWLPLFLLWPSLSSLNQIFGTKKKLEHLQESLVHIYSSKVFIFLSFKLVKSFIVRLFSAVLSPWSVEMAHLSNDLVAGRIGGCLVLSRIRLLRKFCIISQCIK